MDVTLTNRRLPWQKLLTTNATTATFVSKVPTVTEPVTVAAAATACKVFEPKTLGEATALRLLPYGAATGATAQIRVIGWSLADGPSTAPQWIPTEIIRSLVSLTGSAGNATGLVLNTEYLAYEPIEVDITGYEKIEVNFNMNSSATGMNALWVLF